MLSPDLQRMAELYRDQYGSETDSLFEALAHDSKVALLNPWLSPSELSSISSQGQVREIAGLRVYVLPKDCKPILINGLLSHYFLDSASLLAPLLLPLEANQRLLDMCAAPGGKTLVTLCRHIPKLFINSNDLSAARLRRLRTVLESYVPKDFLATYIKLSQKDALLFGKYPASYDAILLDAPCSSEAHIARNHELLAKFSKVSKSLPRRQYALLCAALIALKPGGYLMYATCSINKRENEGVIERLLTRKSNCSVVPVQSPFGTSNQFGTTVLPHRDQAGPAFFSLIKKAL